MCVCGFGACCTWRARHTNLPGLFLSAAQTDMLVTNAPPTHILTCSLYIACSFSPALSPGGTPNSTAARKRKTSEAAAAPSPKKKKTAGVCVCARVCLCVCAYKSRVYASVAFERWGLPVLYKLTLARQRCTLSHTRTHTHKTRAHTHTYKHTRVHTHIHRHCGCCCVCS